MWARTTAGGRRARWVHVHGDWLPRHVLGRFHAVLATLRCLWAALSLLLLCGERYDVVVVDQVSAPVLLLRWFSSSKVTLAALALSLPAIIPLPPFGCLAAGRTSRVRSPRCEGTFGLPEPDELGCG